MHLAQHADNAPFDKILQFLDAKWSSDEPQNAIHFAGLLVTTGRELPETFTTHVLEAAIAICERDDEAGEGTEELKETALQTCEAFIANASTAPTIQPFVQPIFQAALRYLSYDPNGIPDEDIDNDSGADRHTNGALSDADFEENDDDEDDTFDDDDDEYVSGVPIYCIHIRKADC